MTLAGKRQRDIIYIYVQLIPKKVKLFVEMLNGNNDLHVAPLMTECMHRMHALKRGVRTV